ncbi:MAG: nuclear transport factor 2 family protein [Alcanivoracaceae bacterium]|jgi:hypothetical protein|nr:nuclear transport factor 2 family protein [Alcanivoracaceae bacterium]
MRTPIEHLFGSLKDMGDEQALEEMIFERYAAEATFEDPLQQARGRKAILKMYQDMARVFPDMSATLKRQACDGDSHVAEWEMTFRSRLWPKAITISGVTWLTLDSQQRIVAHVDYWDLWQFLRRALPIPAALLERLPEPLRHLIE